MYHVSNRHRFKGIKRCAHLSLYASGKRASDISCLVAAVAGQFLVNNSYMNWLTPSWSRWWARHSFYWAKRSPDREKAEKRKLQFTLSFFSGNRRSLDARQSYKQIIHNYHLSALTQTTLNWQAPPRRAPPSSGRAYLASPAFTLSHFRLGNTVTRFPSPVAHHGSTRFNIFSNI